MKMVLFLLKIMVVVFLLVFIKRGVSALEVMTKIGAGGNLIKDSFSGRFTRCWVSVNALSNHLSLFIEWMENIRTRI
jgi:hypothetical protein